MKLLVRDLGPHPGTVMMLRDEDLLAREGIVEDPKVEEKRT